jgi:DNA-binding response OmpR family regulator
MSDAPFSALKFMILDDEIIIALDLEYMLTDLAILDINVRGVLSFPIAEVLRDRGVPVIFASGYGQLGLIAAFRGAHILTKPFDIIGLARIVAQARRSPNREVP